MFRQWRRFGHRRSTCLLYLACQLPERRHGPSKCTRRERRLGVFAATVVRRGTNLKVCARLSSSAGSTGASFTGVCFDGYQKPLDSLHLLVSASNTLSKFLPALCTLCMTSEAFAVLRDTVLNTFVDYRQYLGSGRHVMPTTGFRSELPWALNGSRTSSWPHTSRAGYCRHLGLSATSRNAESSSKRTD